MTLSETISTISKLSIFAAIVAVATPQAANAQSKSQIAKSCLDAVAVGDKATAQPIASEIMGWSAIFSTKVRLDGEKCLQAVTGAYWKYFTTKGQFLSEDAARAEEQFIGEATQRKAAKNENILHLNCELSRARRELSDLEEQFELVRNARSVEVTSATMKICTRKFFEDEEDALLDPICNVLFSNNGLPNTEIEFNSERFAAAKLRLSLAAIELWQLEKKSSENDTDSSDQNDC